MKIVGHRNYTDTQDLMLTIKFEFDSCCDGVTCKYMIYFTLVELLLVQQPSRRFPINLAKIPSTQVLLILVEEVV